MTWITDQNLDPKLQDWGEAYKELCAIIKAKLPEVKHIDLYYGQDQVVDQDGNWIPFRAPAIFLQFEAAQVNDLGDNTQQLLMDITMYLCMETVQDTNHGSAGQRRAMEFIGVLRKMHMVMHGAEGDHFSPLSRVALAKKADAPPYMYMYGQTYRCVLLDNSTSKQYDFLAAGTLGLEIEPYSAPPVTDDRLVVVRNTDNTYSVEVTAPGDHLLPNVVHVDSNGALRELPAMTPMMCTPAGSGLPGRAVVLNASGMQVNDAIVPPGTDVTIAAPSGTVQDSAGLVDIALVDSGGIYTLPAARIAYQRGTETLYTEPYPTAWDATNLLPGIVIPSRNLRNQAGLDLAIEITLAHLLNNSLPEAPPATVQRIDSAGNDIGTPIVAQSGASTPVPCPDGSVQRRDSAGVPIGQLIPVRSNQVGLDVPCPDGTVRSAATSALYTTPVRSNGILTLAPVRILRGNGTTQDVEYRPNTTSPVFTETNRLDFIFDLADGETLAATVDGTTAGTYTVLASDGGSGTITFSRNGGAFAAIGSGILLAAGDNIRCRRTTTTASGWVRITTA